MLIRTTAFAFFFCGWALLACADDPASNPLVEAIKSSEGEALHTAIDAVADAGETGAEAVGALTELLASDDIEAAWRSARALGALGDASAPAVDALTAALESDDTRVVAYSAYALGEIGEAAKPAAPKLIDVAFNEDALVRRAAQGALRNIKPDRSVTIPHFMKVLESSNPDAIMPALHTLAEGGKEVVPVLVEALKHEKAAYWAAIVLTEIGPDAAEASEALAGAIQSDDPELRLQAILALGAIGDAAKPQGDKIAAALKDESPGVRYAATYTLGTLMHTESESAIKTAAREGDDFQRVAAAWAIAKFHPDDKKVLNGVVRLLVEALKVKKNPHVRRAAARAIIEINVPDDIKGQHLAGALDDTDPEVIGFALDAIASLGAKALPRLIDRVKDEKLRLYAVRIIYRLGEEAAPAVPTLVEALADESTAADIDFHRAVQFALGRIGPAAEPAVPYLVKSLDSDDELVRNSAIFALAKIGPVAKEAIEPLKKNVAGENEKLKLLSAWALLKIEGADSEFAKLAVPMLVEALSNEHEYVRVEAAIALGELGQTAAPAMDALTKSTTEDESEAVKNAAAAAMKKIQGE